MIESTAKLLERVAERARTWNVAIQDTLETPNSLLAFGTRGNQPVVLKVVRQEGDEWRCGEVLDAFDGNGTVKVYEYIDGATLLERLNPATPLAAMALSGRDDEATHVIAEVIQRMTYSSPCSTGFSTVTDWGNAFRRYLASGDSQIPRDLVEHAEQVYLDLCGSQQVIRLLHGDLHHYNILFDSVRGWTAIDPKGVIGEIEYEVGASLRNPYEEPEWFACQQRVASRLRNYEGNLKVDFNRALKWGFTQAVLSAIWTVEDAETVDSRNPAIMLANAMQPMLE